MCVFCACVRQKCELVPGLTFCAMRAVVPNWLAMSWQQLPYLCEAGKKGFNSKHLHCATERSSEVSVQNSDCEDL